MMMVTVKFYGVVMGEFVERHDTYEVPYGTTVRSLMELFFGNVAHAGEGTVCSDSLSTLWDSHVVLLNGHGLSPEKLSAQELKEGDTVMMYLPVEGG